LIIW